MDSEPESEQETALATLRSQGSGWIPRSCYGCNNKKIRCDKKEPCSQCIRAGRPCTYPAMGPRKRRAKKTIMEEMATRISNLEKSVAKIREEAAPSRTANTTPSHSDNLSERSIDDILVQKGSSSQYFNEILLSRVIGEERNFESALTPPQTGSPHEPISSPFNALGILSSPSLSIAPASLHPPKQLAVRLWKIYVDNVEGCTGLKLLHIPTDEVKVYSTIDDPITAPLDNLALSFAIYFGSIVSLDGPEAQVTLGQDKHMLLLQLKFGLEQAFAHGDFLDRPTMTGLHALAIYLAALRIHNHGKGIWILNGLAIRIAQSLGLHRDGERLGLAPFQSEIRRRLWWHLLSRDSRAGEDYGLENINSLLLVSDVGLPTNIDDTDLYPEMQRLPTAKKGWTAMTFSLINIELAKSMQKLTAVTASSSPSSPPREDVRVQIIKQTRARVEKWYEYCNPVIPQQRSTLFCSRFLLRKLDFVTKLKWILLQHSDPHADFTTEQNLVEALEILKPRLYIEDDLLKQYAWVRKAYPQYHVMMYILWHLCVRPEGPSIDRAWEAVEFLFSHELWDESSMGFGSKLAVLEALRTKALSIREKVRKINLEGNVRTSDRSSGLVSGEVPPDGEVFSAYLLGDTGGGEFALDGGTAEWPNWAALVQGFQYDSPDVFW